MPWCPKCKNEFVEGITHCSDCGETLVDNLQDYESNEFKPDSFEPDTFEADAFESDSFESDAFESDTLESDTKFNPSPNSMISPPISPLYTKASDRKEEYSSSSFSFLIVAVITFIVGILISLNKINLSAQPSARLKYILILFAITVVFVLLAFFSNRKAKLLSHSVDQEEQQLTMILAYFKQQPDVPQEDQYSTMDELYFARNEWLMQNLHDYDSTFTTAYCDYLAEYLYQELFEA